MAETVADSLTKLVPFTLDNQRFALPLSAVERVVRAVEITPLPKAPEIVMGVVNIQGRIIPVFNIRKRFRLPEREINLSDQLILSNTSKRPVVIVVDEVRGVAECPEDKITMADNILPGIEHVEGVAKLEDGMFLIHDIEKFLSIEEEDALDNAIRKI